MKEILTLKAWIDSFLVLNLFSELFLRKVAICVKVMLPPFPNNLDPDASACFLRSLTFSDIKIILKNHFGKLLTATRSTFCIPVSDQFDVWRKHWHPSDWCGTLCRIGIALGSKAQEFSWPRIPQKCSLAIFWRPGSLCLRWPSELFLGYQRLPFEF